MTSTQSERYVCQLESGFIKKAKDELNENESDRLSAIDALRNWLQEQKHVKFHTDDKNLLRILRHAKFSQIKARETIELVTKTAIKSPDISFNLDSADEDFINFVKLGTLFYLPGVDDFGRKVLFYKQDAFPLDQLMKKFKLKTLIKYWNTFFLSYFNDDMFQINGLVIVIDMTGCSIKTVTSFRDPDLIKWEKENQNVHIARLKSFHYYNIGSFFEGIFNIYKTFLKKKFIDRINVHETLESLYEKVPKRMLPSDYLPDDYNGPSGGTTKEIIDENMKRLKCEKTRNPLLKYSDKSKFYYDETKKEKYSMPIQHFRKLNVD